MVGGLLIIISAGIFGPNFAYLFILTLSSHWYAKWRRGFAKHHFGWLRSLMKMLLTLEPHHIFDQFLHTYTVLKLAGKMTKNIKKKYWSHLDSNNCASGCWITRKPLRPLCHHILYTTVEQFTYIPFTCANQIKIAQPLHDPGTRYGLIYVHQGSCTLQSVNLKT